MEIGTNLNLEATQIDYRCYKATDGRQILERQSPMPEGGMCNEDLEVREEYRNEAEKSGVPRALARGALETAMVMHSEDGKTMIQVFFLSTKPAK